MQKNRVSLVKAVSIASLPVLVLGIMPIAALMCIWPEPASATEKETSVGIETVRVVEDLHLCGATTWTLEVQCTGAVTPEYAERSLELIASISGLRSKAITLGEVRGNRITFIPAQEERIIPVMTSSGVTTVVELRSARRPAVEQLKLFRTPADVSSVVRFQAGIPATQQLESLLAISKFTENQSTPSCGADSCGVENCTNGCADCGCTGEGTSKVSSDSATVTELTGNSRTAPLLVSSTVSTCDSSGCGSSTSCCNGHSTLSMRQIDDRTFAFESTSK